MLRRLIVATLGASTLVLNGVASAQGQAQVDVQGTVTIGAPQATTVTQSTAVAQPCMIPPAPGSPQGGYVVQGGYAPSGAYGMPVYVQRSPLPQAYNGGPVPPGAHIESRPLVGLVVAGATIFSTMWAIDALAGIATVSVSSNTLWMTVPLVGPFVFVGIYPGAPASSVALLAGTGVVQIGGMAMLIAGLVVRRQMVVYAGNDRPSNREVMWAITPGTTATPTGLTLTVQTF